MAHPDSNNVATTNEWHMAAEEFCRDATAVAELAAFLATDTGVKLKRVLAGHHPLNQVAAVKHLTPKDTLTLAAAEQQNTQGVLGFQRGYQAVVSLITQTLTRPLPKPQPASRKSGRGLAPHAASLP